MKEIRQRPIDVLGLQLSPEEGFVLSRIDGRSGVRELVALTGLDEGRVLSIVERLASVGAVDIDPPAPDATPLDAALQAFLSNAPPPSDEEPSDEEPSDEASSDEEEDPADRPVDEREYRQVYETRYRALAKDQRLEAAGCVTGVDLLALTFDPDPQVVQAVLARTEAGLEHARFIALHHRTQIGLEGVARRAEVLKDARVQRYLLRNPQLPSTILNRIVGPKLLLDTYKIAIDREIPERSRVMTRDLLRKKFTLSSSDEKAALVLKTDGRCLVLLTNVGLDARATQILCGKSNPTIVLIQAFARWSATPPALLSHLLKLPIVRRNSGLKKMVLKHPNTPAEAKRM